MKNLKLFVVRKYIMAKSALDAIKREKKIVPDDVYIDSDWQKAQIDNTHKNMGFSK